MFLARLLSRIL